MIGIRNKKGEIVQLLTLAEFLSFDFGGDKP